MNLSRAGTTRLVDILSRRAAVDVIDALTSGALAERALVSRLSAYNNSVVSQRVEDLRRIDVIEAVPENGDLRLSPRGRRLLGVLDSVEAWAADIPEGSARRLR